MDSSTELQHTLELAFHRAPVGLCVSRHRTIEICNEAFAQMFGYAQADLMGHSLARLSDGALFWCHVAGRALDRADPFAHAVWMFEDISQRRPVGAALKIREREIAQHIVTGATSKQIARLLEISHRTVEAHRARLMRKLDATTTGELVARLLGAPR